MPSNFWWRQNQTPQKSSTWILPVLTRTSTSTVCTLWGTQPFSRRTFTLTLPAILDWFNTTCWQPEVSIIPCYPSSVTTNWCLLCVAPVPKRLSRHPCVITWMNNASSPGRGWVWSWTWPLRGGTRLYCIFKRERIGCFGGTLTCFSKRNKKLPGGHGSAKRTKTKISTFKSTKTKRGSTLIATPFNAMPVPNGVEADFKQFVGENGSTP